MAEGKVDNAVLLIQRLSSGIKEPQLAITNLTYVSKAIQELKELIELERLNVEKLFNTKRIVSSDGLNTWCPPTCKV